MASSTTKNLVVFDFDWSFADQDTDRWVFEVLAPDLRRKMRTLQEDVQWTDLVAMCLREAHGRGITKEQIQNALRIMPVHPAMGRGVSALKDKGETTFICISNANSVFIPTILEARSLQHVFETIVTNPAEWKADGLLEVRRRVDPSGPQHSCKVGCSPNMCKGEELDAYLKTKGHIFNRIIYVGDGSNDFCPALRLRSQDMVLARTFGGLKRRIESEGEREGLRCHIRYWTGAWEVEEAFQEIDLKN